MRIPALFRELQYIGRAEGDRSTYHVFKGDLGYLVVPPNHRGGLNVNVVSPKIPDIIARKFRGQQVTGPLLAKRTARSLRHPFRAAEFALRHGEPRSCSQTEQARGTGNGLQDSRFSS
jgi:hypothetical protein